MCEKLYVRANYLALFTIVYNLVEGGVSVWLGAADETLTLFGFGVDSFNQYNCVVECRTCARLCPAEAISFPDAAVFSDFIKEKLTSKEKQP